MKAADIYEYIIMTLEKAIELLPEENQAGRIDKWAAKGLLAKVYLTNPESMLMVTDNEMLTIWLRLPVMQKTSSIIQANN